MGQPMVKVNAKYPIQSFVKRIFDLFFSILLLPLFILLYPIIGLLIKLDSAGPIFYRDERMGRWGKPFKCWKFRTMVVNAD
ncbi:MAG: sugar transferase, partial [Gammaproteobacteria bacterium]|nr:sugar transferase [Gammaproteobacteria bacterium]